MSRSPGGFTHRGDYASDSCSGDRGNVVTDVGTYCFVAVRRGRLGGARRFGVDRGEGWGHMVAAPAQLVKFTAGLVQILSAEI